MAILTVQEIVIAGITPSYAAVSAGGDEFPNDGNTYIEFKNSSGANAYTITFVTPATLRGVAVENPTLVVPISGNKKVGPFPADVFNNSSGRVAMTYSGAAPATDLTVGAFKGV